MCKSHELAKSKALLAVASGKDNTHDIAINMIKVPVKSNDISGDFCSAIL